jgi:hypothetical protein
VRAGHESYQHWHKFAVMRKMRGKRPAAGKPVQVVNQLGMDPIELLRMINGKAVPTRAVISGLAKELHSNVSLLADRRN